MFFFFYSELTAFKELEVSVSVMEELHIIIGRCVSVLLFLFIPKHKDTFGKAKETSSVAKFCRRTKGQTQSKTADFMFQVGNRK